MCHKPPAPAAEVLDEAGEVGSVLSIATRAGTVLAAAVATANPDHLEAIGEPLGTAANVCPKDQAS